MIVGDAVRNIAVACSGPARQSRGKCSLSARRQGKHIPRDALPGWSPRSTVTHTVVYTSHTYQ